jgi:hypothetical protein|tara:strand:+ start:6426 stop:6605 length:180 start_codon:yes stop_codon:yes gene_type:complete
MANISYINQQTELQERSKVLDALSVSVTGVLEMLQQYEPLLLPDELMLIYELEAINGAA